MVYKAKIHNIHKAINAADLRFPAYKNNIAAQLKNIRIYVSVDSDIALSDLVMELETDFFENSSAFYNAIVSHDTAEAMSAYKS